MSAAGGALLLGGEPGAHVLEVPAVRAALTPDEQPLHRVVAAKERQALTSFASYPHGNTHTLARALTRARKQKLSHTHASAHVGHDAGQPPIPSPTHSQNPHQMAQQKPSPDGADGGRLVAAVAHPAVALHELVALGAVGADRGGLLVHHLDGGNPTQLDDLRHDRPQLEPTQQVCKQFSETCPGARLGSDQGSTTEGG